MITVEQKKGVRTWIEIDSKAIESNVRVFRGLISSKTMLMAVVKSNAYGHGLVEFTHNVVSCGVDWIGVDTLVEGIRLRKEGITLPILVLGYTLPEMMGSAVENNISLSVSHESTFLAIKEASLSGKLKVHIKVDTGMHRQGFLLENQKDVILNLKALADKVEVEGLFTHFSSAKNPSFPAYTLGQIEQFESWKKLFTDSGFTPLVHASATSGTILFPQAHYDMVRIGIGLYGLWPSKETEAFAKDRVRLLPALSWKTVISEIKPLPQGSKISYDGTETLARDSVVGVCPIGYWHGYPRALSSIGEVLVNGKRAKVLGRVAMDMIIVDLTDCGTISVRDEVVLIGKSAGNEIGAERFADLADTSWYEIITRINPLIRKVYF